MNIRYHIVTYRTDRAELVSVDRSNVKVRAN